MDMRISRKEAWISKANETRRTIRDAKASGQAVETERDRLARVAWERSEASARKEQ